MQPKAFENMTKAELLEAIEDLMDTFSIWRCPKCGGFGLDRTICWHCRFDPTDPDQKEGLSDGR